MLLDRTDTFPVFLGKAVDEYIEERRHSIASKIRAESSDYILSVNEDQYVDYICNEHRIENLDIRFGDSTVSRYETSLPAEYFPNVFGRERGQQVRVTVIRYHCPFDGPQELLRLKPNPSLLNTPRVLLEGSELCFDIVKMSDRPEAITQEAATVTGAIEKQLAYLSAQIRLFNEALHDEVQRAVRARKLAIQQADGFLSSLGVPFHARMDVPATFSVPKRVPQRGKAATKPVSRETPYTPEPTLDDKTYTRILEIIHDVGREFERLPSTYAQKDEETLRDHLLLLLEPNIAGSATGETFNRHGKTDILLRHEGKNLFVGECKFWRGKKSYLLSIDQLLGYLTWRDSKSAIVLFVPNQDFSSVLSTVGSATPEHPCYVRKVGTRDETWFNFLFCLPNDRNRVMQVAVMLYHIPATKGPKSTDTTDP